jgi:hypothetical protein
MVAVGLVLTALAACGPEYGGQGQVTHVCDALVVTLRGVSPGRSAASDDDARFAETRSLIQCATVDAWVSAACRIEEPLTEDDVLAYLGELCSRSENLSTPVCRDRERSILG